MSHRLLQGLVMLRGSARVILRLISFQDFPHTVPETIQITCMGDLAAPEVSSTVGTPHNRALAEGWEQKAQKASLAKHNSALYGKLCSSTAQDTKNGTSAGTEAASPQWTG